MEKHDLAGSKTQVNLMKAFTGESQARNRYTYFASVAKKEGYEQIADIFTETANNEKEHAKVFYKFIQASNVEFCTKMPHCYGNTHSNLLCAAEGEREEWSNLYPSFADIADEEGFYEIGVAFRLIASVEKHHDSRFKKLAQNIAEHTVFRKNNTTLWKCRNCGFVFDGNSAPDACPTCHHPKAYFELLCDNF